MNEISKEHLDRSLNVISKLQLLSFFFDDETVYKIFIRTQVIHKLFESTPELDINRLDLFHLQFTESIIGLLRKIKENNEKSVSVLFDEIQVNEQLIENLKDILLTYQGFENDVVKQESMISKSIDTLYQNLSDYSTDNPFRKELYLFGNQYAEAFFIPVTDKFLYQLVEFNENSVFENGYGIIGKKLLGHQCKYQFKNTFYCGFRSPSLLVEVYRINGEEEYFIFCPPKNLYLECALAKISEIILPDNVTNKRIIIEELKQKNEYLKKEEVSIKKKIPADVAVLLNDYLKKIAAIDFLGSIDDFNIQANILKTMLNTESI